MSHYKIWHPFSRESFSEEKIKIIKGENEFLYDINGKRYVDLISSWWTNIHGHCNERIKNAIIKQVNELDHVIFTNFTHDAAINLSEELYKILGKKFHKFFFSDNGSTSVEVAIKIAIQYWKNKGFKNKTKIIAFEGGYHGDTFGAMSIGKKSGFFSHFEDMFFEVYFNKYPHTWLNDQESNTKDKESLIELEEFILKNKDKIAFLIIEPLIQGASGMRFSSIEFNNKVLEICKKNNIITIFDEVMTGFGRTGEFFAYQHLNLEPDIICLSKGITGGFLPLGATGVKKFIYEEFLNQEFEKSFLHGHSYTANPIVCSTATEAIKILNEENCIKKVLKIEQIYRNFYENNKNNNKIEKIRFLGDIIAFNIKDFNNFNKEDFIKKCHQEGLIIRPLREVIYFIPPYIINLNLLGDSLKKVVDILNRSI